MLDLESLFTTAVLYDIKAVSLIGLLNCWALAFGLMVVSANTPNKTTYRFLALFLFIEGLRMLAYYISFWVAPSYIVHLVPLMALRMLLAPILYIFCKSLTLTHFSIHPRHLLHGLPFVLIGIVLTQNVAGPYGKTTIYSTTCVSALSYLIYALLSLRVIKKHEEEIAHYYSSTESISLKWLRYFCAYFALLGILHLLVGSASFFTDFEHVGNYAVFSLASGLVFCYLITFFCIYKSPNISELQNDRVRIQADKLAAAQDTTKDPRPAISAIQTTASAQHSTLQPPNKEHEPKDDSKYASSGLEREQAEAVYNELKTLMSSEQLYLDEGLKIAGLAEKIGLPLPHVSQALNQAGGCNFYEFVNIYRVEAAADFMRADQEGKLSVGKIIEQAGFASPNTFYRNFKKHMGMSPKEFAKQVKQNPQLEQEPSA